MMTFLQQFDHQLTSAIDSLPAGLNPLMKAATLVGEPAVIICLMIILAAVAWWKGRRRISYAAFATLVAFAGNAVLKHLVHRARPHTLFARSLKIHSYSFPSGHAFGAMVVFGLLAYLAAKYLPQKWKVVTAATLGLLVFLIGLSRVYLGAHFPTDVLAGWLLGGISLVLIIKFIKP